MSHGLRIALIVLGCLLAASAAVLTFSPDARMLLGVALQSDPGPPAIAAGIDCHDWRDCEETSRRFDAIVARRFPLGTAQSALEDTLLAQNFRRDPNMPKTCTLRGVQRPIGVLTIECPDWDPGWDPRNELVYHWGRFPCGSTVGVRWSADRTGRIVHTVGYFYYGCL